MSSTTYSAFDDNWNKLDTTSKGFIYGRDLPSLLVGASKLDNSSLRIIEKFSEEQPFYKLYKSVISGVLKNLVGLSVEEMGFNAGVSGSNGNDKDKDKDNNNDFAQRKSDEIESIETGSTVSDEIEKLRGLLKEKDEIIELKNEELADMTREVKIYREKFNYIVREFTFYRQNADMERRDAGSTTAGLKRSKDKMDLRVEFLKNEFKRQLEEQATIIKDLRQRLRGEVGIFNSGFPGDPSPPKSSSSSSRSKAISNSFKQNWFLDALGVPFWTTITKRNGTSISVIITIIVITITIISMLTLRTVFINFPPTRFTNTSQGSEYTMDQLLFPAYMEDNLATPDFLLVYEEREETEDKMKVNDSGSREHVPFIKKFGNFVLRCLRIEFNDESLAESHHTVAESMSGRNIVDYDRLDAYNKIFGLL